MGDRRVDGFFYGLFMDEDVLKQSGVEAQNPRRGYAEGFALRIGNRATLLPSENARAYGMILSMTHRDLETLYSAPGLEVYRPEALLIRTTEGESVPALCYNLLEAPALGEANAEYAVRLRDALERRGFPSEYIATVE